MKPPRPPAAAQSRDARLKAALRANIARRKDQARARDAAETDGGPAPAGPMDDDEGKG
ncbi:MAG: hypothetical protein ACO3XL_05950 [Gemmobacter sp.]